MVLFSCVFKEVLVTETRAPCLFRFKSCRRLWEEIEMGESALAFSHGDALPRRVVEVPRATPACMAEPTCTWRRHREP